MTDKKIDYLGNMIDAYNTELARWDCSADNPGVPGTSYSVKRDNDVKLRGDFDGTHNAYDRLSQRAAMRDAIRALTSVPLEEMGIDEEDAGGEMTGHHPWSELRDKLEARMTDENQALIEKLPLQYDCIIVGTGWSEDVKGRLGRVEASLIRIEEKIDALLCR